MVPDEVLVPGPVPVLGHEHQPKGRRVRGSVVGTVRLLADHRELTLPDLMEDLARFLVLELVDLGSLERAEDAQRPARELRTDP